MRHEMRMHLCRSTCTTSSNSFVSSHHNDATFGLESLLKHLSLRIDAVTRRTRWCSVWRRHQHRPTFLVR
jgi:hypothetical protein